MMAAESFDSRSRTRGALPVRSSRILHWRHQCTSGVSQGPYDGICITTQITYRRCITKGVGLMLLPSQENRRLRHRQIPSTLVLVSARLARVSERAQVLCICRPLLLPPSLAATRNSMGADSRGWTTCAGPAQIDEHLMLDVGQSFRRQSSSVGMYCR